MAADPGDMWRRLLERRIVVLSGMLGAEAATALAVEVTLLDPADPRPLQLHLSTPDGDLDSCLALADALDAAPVPVHARCAGMVGGPALAVLVACRRRRALPTTRFRLTEPRVDLEGTASQLQQQAEAQWRQVHRLHRRLAAATGRPLEELDQDLRAGRGLSADEALAYGLIDGIDGDSGADDRR